MQKISVAIIGWGNVGRGCKRALEETSDIVLAGVVRRPLSLNKQEPELENARVVADIKELGKVDVALLCIPSREVPERVKEYQALGICTVDSFDEHDRIVGLKKDLDINAKVKKVVSIFATGWDPGTDSGVRAIMKIASITGHTTTTFGGTKGGRSMGHTAAVKVIAGVKDAVALTLENGPGKQKRKVYVEIEKGFEPEKVAACIKADPYFIADPTEVLFVKNINKYNTLHHEGEVERTGMQVNQKYRVEGNNPELTANIMVSAVRACIASRERGDYGTYTFIERPLVDYLPGATFDEKMEGY